MTKKKVEVASGLRFSQKPSELPYLDLFEARTLTLAISKMNRLHVYPIDDFTRDAKVFGLVHRDGGLYSDGSEEPLLPFELSFDFGHPRSPADHIGEGRCGLNDWDNKYPYYWLSMGISDPGGVIWSALEKAFANSVVSGADFFHVRCLRNEDTLPIQGSKPFNYDAIQARGKSLDAGEIDLPRVVFDKVAFADELVTKAPAWSWAWDDHEMDRPGFHSAGVRKYRAGRAKWA